MARALTRLAAAALLALAAPLIPSQPASAQAAAPLGAAMTARPLSSLYPNLDPAVLAAATSARGYSASAEAAPRLLPAGEAGAALARALEGRKRSFLIETLALIPGLKAESKLAVYNSMTKFRGLSGLTYSSKSKGSGAVLFSDVTRISDLRRAERLPDETVASLPESAEHLIRLKDANFGSSYYRVELDTRAPGIVFAMTNARALTYFLIPIIAEGGLFCIFYVEPIREGLLIYSIDGGNLPSAAEKQVNLSSAVRKRAAAISGWLASDIGR
jgi:hypothetical protein